MGLQKISALLVIMMMFILQASEGAVERAKMER